MPAVTADKVVIELEAKVADYIRDLNRAEQAFREAVKQTEQGSGKISASVSAASAKGSASLKAFQASSQTSLNAIATAYDGLYAQMSGSGGPGQILADQAQKAQAASQGFQGSVGNIVAQFNDIGTTAYGGMQPLLIGLQQGTQLSQAFAGQNLPTVIGRLKEGFLALASPISIGAVALTALAAAGIQYAASAFESEEQTQSFKEALGELKSAIGELREGIDALDPENVNDLVDRFGTLTGQIWDAVQAARNFAAIEAGENLNSSLRSISEEAEGVIAQLLEVSQMDIEPRQRTIRSFRGADLDPGNWGIYDISRELELTEDQVRSLAYALRDLSNANGPENVANSATRIRELFEDIYQNSQDIPQEITNFLSQLNRVELGALEVKNLFEQMEEPVERLTPEMKDFREETEKAAKAVQEMIEDLQIENKKLELEIEFKNDPAELARRLAVLDLTSTPNFSSLPDQEQQTAIENIKLYATANAELQRAKDELYKASRETSRRGPLDDRSELEKYTEETESIQRQITALRELGSAQYEAASAVQYVVEQQRLVNDYKQRGIAINAELMAQINEEARIRVAANEELRKVKAELELSSSVDQINAETEALNKQREALQGFTGTANEYAATRRSMAAVEEILNRAKREGIELSEQEIQSIRDAVAANRLVKDQLEEQERLLRDVAKAGALDRASASNEVTRRQIEALRELSVTSGNYEEVLDAIAQREALLNELRREGVEITEEVIAQVDEQVSRNQQLDAELDGLVEAHRQVAAALGGLRDASRETFTSMITGASSASEAVSRLLDRLANMAANAAFDSLFSGLTSSFAGGGGGGLFGGLFGFSNGGYTGAGADLEPAGIVHKNEVVFSHADVMRHGGVAATERLRRGSLAERFAKSSPNLSLGGYSRGGIVGGTYSSAPLPPTPPSGGFSAPSGSFGGYQAPTLPDLSQNAPLTDSGAGTPQGIAVDVGVTVDNQGTLQAYVKRISQQEASRASQDSLSIYDRGLPQRVQQINQTPRRRA